MKRIDDTRRDHDELAVFMCGGCGHAHQMPESSGGPERCAGCGRRIGQHVTLAATDVTEPSLEGALKSGRDQLASGEAKRELERRLKGDYDS